MNNKLDGWLRPILYLGRNPWSMVGAWLTTGSAVTLLVFWLVELIRGGPSHPYAGIFLFMVLPALFIAGLILMPFGLFMRRRALRASGQLPHVYPHLDLGDTVLRRGLILVGLATLANVAITGTASYKGIEHMESVQFCGQTCHTVMAPEYSAYSNSPHSRVACTQCHIGPGADWFVKSKLSGARQVLAVNLGTYSRPIPSPVHHLRPARETCEQCHWPNKFVGDKLVVKRSYASDEKNTESVMALLMHIGGHGGSSPQGIHGRHLDQGERIEYVATDERRQSIAVVRYRDDSGKVVEYVSADKPATPEQLAKGETRKMDCIDCHNRPTHAFEMPERAVDKAIERGLISRELPFVRKKAVEVLRVEYPDKATGLAKIEAGVRDFYAKDYPEVAKDKAKDVEAAAKAVQAIWDRNIFPDMKVNWGVHPNNLGHEDFPGCFRCHDDQHKSADGKTISQDCETCHNVIDDPKVLASLGVK
jgi:hypothetical protein